MHIISICTKQVYTAAIALLTGTSVYTDMRTVNDRVYIYAAIDRVILIRENISDQGYIYADDDD